MGVRRPRSSGSKLDLRVDRLQADDARSAAMRAAIVRLALVLFHARTLRGRTAARPDEALGAPELGRVFDLP